MRNLFILAVLVTSPWNLAGLHAEENLFSEVAMESVFEGNASLTQSVASLSDGSTLERITGTSTLMLAMKAAGYAPKEAGDKVTIQVDHAGWKLPTTLEVQIELDRIVCEMSLIEIPDASGINTETLLKLLSQNDPVGGGIFAYDAQTKLLQLRSSFENRGISAKQLKANMTKLAAFAEKNSDLWSSLKQSATTKTPTAATTATATTPTTKPVTTIQKPVTAPAFSLVGNWGSSLKTGESIAIQITQDSKFQLVTVKAGKSSVSKGKVTIAGNKITLAGDDKVTLNCTFTQSTATKFQLIIVDNQGKAKLAIDFTKAQ